jgi:hypothetical protein
LILLRRTDIPERADDLTRAVDGKDICRETIRGIDGGEHTFVIDKSSLSPGHGIIIEPHHVTFVIDTHLIAWTSRWINGGEPAIGPEEVMGNTLRVLVKPSDLSLVVESFREGDLTARHIDDRDLFY